MEKVLRIDLTAGTCWTQLVSRAGQRGPLSESVESGQRVTVEPEQPSLPFPDGVFDAVTCPLGMSLLPGIHRALAEWLRVTKPGGSLSSSAFAAKAFQPLIELYAEQLFEFGLAPIAGAAIYPWRRFAHAEAVSCLVRDAGFRDVNVVVEQVGSYLPDANAWWDIVAGSTLSLPLKGLSKGNVETFKTNHLHEVAMLATARGIWLDMSIASVTARKGESIQ